MASKPMIVKRSVRISGHATSVSLELPFWDALCELAERRRVSINSLIAAVDAGRNGNLSSAIRVFVLDSCRRGELPNDLIPPAAGAAASIRTSS